MTLDTLADRVQHRLETVKKSARAVSLAVGSDAFVRNILTGKSLSPRAENLERLAVELQTTTDWLLKGAGPEDRPMENGYHSEVTPYSGDLVPVTVTGTTKAGAFLEADAFVQGERVVIFEPRDARFPQARQVAFDIDGDSMNDLKPFPLIHGQRVICVDFEDLRGRVPIRDGMVVVVERLRDGGLLREWSVKQVEYYHDRTEFHPRSTNPTHKPIVVPHNRDPHDGQTVSILALVRRITNEVPL